MADEYVCEVVMTEEMGQAIRPGENPRVLLVRAGLLVFLTSCVIAAFIYTLVFGVENRLEEFEHAAAFGFLAQAELLASELVLTAEDDFLFWEVEEKEGVERLGSAFKRIHLPDNVIYAVFITSDAKTITAGYYPDDGARTVAPEIRSTWQCPHHPTTTTHDVGQSRVYEAIAPASKIIRAATRDEDFFSCAVVGVSNKYVTSTDRQFRLEIVVRLLIILGLLTVGILGVSRLIRQYRDEVTA